MSGENINNNDNRTGRGEANAESQRGTTASADDLAARAEASEAGAADASAEGSDAGTKGTGSAG